MGLSASRKGRIRAAIVSAKPGRPADQLEALCDRVAWLSEVVASLAGVEAPADKFADLIAHIEACRNSVDGDGDA